MDVDTDYHLSRKELDDKFFVEYFRPDLGATLENMSSLSPSYLLLLYAVNDAAKNMVILDLNKDSKVSEEEFLIFAEPRAEMAYAEVDFSQADHDGDGVLTMKEYEETGHSMDVRHSRGDQPGISGFIKEAFNKIDVDNDGKLSHEEYTSVQGVDLFTQKDVDKNGVLSHKEYIQFEVNEGKDASEAESVFEEIDNNRDGSLTRIESKGIHHSLDFDRDDPEEKAAEFAAIDEDSSGGIDHGEWSDFQTIHSEGAIPQAQINEEFFRHDYNHDGFVDEQEFVQPLGTHASKAAEL